MLLVRFDNTETMLQCDNMKLFKTLNTKELVLVPESPVSVSHAMIYVTLKR